MEARDRPALSGLKGARLENFACLLQTADCEVYTANRTVTRHDGCGGWGLVKQHAVRISTPFEKVSSSFMSHFLM
jgi:hypothetical protein